VPVILGFRPARYSDSLPMLEVLAPTREAARDTLRAALAEAAADNAYKGRTITVEPSGSWREGFNIRFQQLRPTRRDDIVLPDELIQVIERNVLGMLKHGAALRAAGRTLRHGLLFHGPPGTGKSMVVRYLASACKDHTVILMTGQLQGLVRESCQIAKLLAPSIVVLEDVDLVAEDRDQNRCPVILHELMNEMDGLGPRAEVIFLLTTNRPEMIETALSARPGRIDQAIAFPLPDEACRQRLFELYGAGLDLSAVDVSRWVGQTNGVSPAFIEELLRRSALLAAERGADGPALKITDDDIHSAIRELIHFGGELTQKLLGYRTGRIGYQS
ncbi:MAG: ATP-binding protein, partial [Planctomycetia bacterium]|nr:ATP-binding protein [Planctomycetia bacterium]